MVPKPLTISIAGKGGTGKTSITALILRAILEKNSFEEILVVDADPASNIPDILGVKSTTSIGAILDSRKKALESGSQDEKGVLKDKIVETIGHGEGFDYLVMGRTCGTGCYCPLNATLRRILDETVKLYDLVLIDFDAGLEHFNRQTDANSDFLLVITDPSRMGFETARRIKELVDELGNSYRHEFLMGCKFTPDMEKLFLSYAAQTYLTPLGIVPYDNQLLTLNLGGQNIFKLDPDSPSYRGAISLWDRLLKKLN